MYNDPPWIFTGRALYQLQLVKADEARKHVPEGLKLVEAFGHTLGGFYLARYDSSPAGSFDELVALTGLVWNPPTSCAWAARVYVNSKDARNHGINSVGLPSRMAEFREVSPADADHQARFTERKKKHGLGGASNWWRQVSTAAKAAQGGVAADNGEGNKSSSTQASTDKATSLQGFPDVQLWNTDSTRGRGLTRVPVCTLTSLPPALRVDGGGLGPRIRMFLPSFSGGTPEHPGLLKYSCDLRTNVRLLPPVRILLPPAPIDPSRSSSSSSGRSTDGSSGSGSSSSWPQQQQNDLACYSPEERGELMHAVLGGKPLLAMAFDRMEMHVDAPLKLELPSPLPPKTVAALTSPDASDSVRR
mmetsp:Transcript_4803/g.13119  ORF Transcript_4803/g.13119 Transcript_4803/m.13119 type:complete len:360 (-) Transcript_4803:55-1134(-)